MAKQTTKALPSDKLSSLALGGSAAAVILLPQAITKAVPHSSPGLRHIQRRPCLTARASVAAVEAAVLAA